MSNREKVAAAHEEHGDNVSAIARETKLSRPCVRDHLKALGIYGKPISGGQIFDSDIPRLPLPAQGKIARYLLSSAQNNTKVHKRYWKSLNTLAGVFRSEDRCERAEIILATFNYNVNAYGQRAVKAGRAKKQGEIWFAPEVRPFIRDEQVEIAPGLVWCGNLCLSPTAARPLSGFKNYTRRKSGIFPHPKVAQESIASAAGRDTKFNYSTGAVTLCNYIEKTAGQKAEFHHTYGALLIEVDHEGNWFPRQVIGTKTGALQDLDIVVDGKKVKRGRRVHTITWGDFHTAWLDKTVRRLGWGGGPEFLDAHPDSILGKLQTATSKNSMLDVLRPEEQHVNDLLDFYSRMHHDIKSARKMYQRWLEGKDSVTAELADAARVLCEIERPWCKTVVVNSNHDRAMERWCDDSRGHTDPPNRRFWYQANDALAEADEAQEEIVLLEWAMRRYGCPKGVKFLGEDDSHVICGDIECGLHGDRGASGTKGTIVGLAQIGDRLNGADKHQAAILWGAYFAGTSSRLRLGYTKGPSAWSHSHIITYPNGKRTIVTMFNGKWRA